ncbi:hypothetical protein [Kitasatospora azatica]|uniref:hypothetical protein n=1 Tax=Kitasatospora azatica TaxID=58347 RepID=UPI000563A9F0|nr:hypothetical protein [Kitasatospora azatica]
MDQWSGKARMGGQDSRVEQAGEGRCRVVRDPLAQPRRRHRRAGPELGQHRDGGRIVPDPLDRRVEQPPMGGDGRGAVPRGLGDRAREDGAPLRQVDFGCRDHGLVVLLAHRLHGQ